MYQYCSNYVCRQILLQYKICNQQFLLSALDTLQYKRFLIAFCRLQNIHFIPINSELCTQYCSLILITTGNYVRIYMTKAINTQKLFFFLYRNMQLISQFICLQPAAHDQLVVITFFCVMHVYTQGSRLMVASCEAKKKQQVRHLQDHVATTMSNLHIWQL